MGFPVNISMLCQKRLLKSSVEEAEVNKCEQYTGRGDTPEMQRTDLIDGACQRNKPQRLLQMFNNSHH